MTELSASSDSAGEGTATPAASPAPAVQLRKEVTFSGLTAELFEDVDDESAPTQPDETSVDVQMGASQLMGGSENHPGGDFGPNRGAIRRSQESVPGDDGR